MDTSVLESSRRWCIAANFSVIVIFQLDIKHPKKAHAEKCVPFPKIPALLEVTAEIRGIG